MQNQIQKNVPVRSQKAKEGWQKVKLGDYVDITSSKRIFAHEYLNVGIPFYRGKEIIEKFNGNEVSTDLFISPQKFKDIESKFGVPQVGDMLLSSVGTLGIPYLVEKDEKFYFKDGNLTWFRKFKNLDNKFLYFWIQSALGKAQLIKHIIGSSQQALTIDGLKKVEIDLPPKEEQKKISSILSSFDDKIEVNNKIAKTLDEMAQTLFKEWFVKFKFPGHKKVKSVDSELGKIPEGWKIGTLGELMDVKHGFAFPSEKFHINGDVPVVKIKNILEDRTISVDDMDFIKLDDFNQNLGNFKVLNGDILIALTGATSGKVGLISSSHKEYLLNQRVGKFQFLKDYYRWFCYTFLTQPKYRDFLLSSSDGSAQGNLSPNQIKSVELIIPLDGLLQEFNLLANSFYEKIVKIKSENQKLAALRDLLLPKLMKGEIGV